MFIYLTLLQMSVLQLEKEYVITRHTCNKDQYNISLVCIIKFYPKEKLKFM